MPDSVRPYALPVVIVIALILGIGAVVMHRQPAPEVTIVPDTPVVLPASDAVLAMADPVTPTFDTFRVEVDGSMVIAGRAAPEQDVAILLAGQEIARVRADTAGSFVVFPVADPSEAPRRLSLLADPDGAAIASETSYIVAPIAAPVVTAEASVPETTAETPPADAPTVLQTDTDGVRIVQGAETGEDPNVALDTITYDPDGDVQLAGRATGDGAVQVYIDNEPVTTSPVTDGGDWQIDLPEIDSGVYTLRIDEVDVGGTVVSRLETPFKREKPQDVAAVLAEEIAEQGADVAMRTVQPGATLWAIAEESLGDGLLYVAVFAANADLIRDPDLIYPGQIFRMPDLDQ